MYEENIKTTQREELISITGIVQRALDKSGVGEGICIVYVPHTTAGITINENADPDVAADILMGLKRIVPYNWPFQHVEGNADSHIKASLVGSSVTIPVKNNRLVLGTWQGIFFCEFDGPRSRSFLIQFIPKAG